MAQNEKSLNHAIVDLKPAIVDVMTTDLCSQEEWLAQNKDTAPHPEVKQAKNALIATMFSYNKILNQLSNQ